eukprot:TRINITY_DN4301_c1_g1_i12.p5 TRINITY_DN4301_c1_g1~~TRINITY_DN4301_c1_g1_i12.p5  ORF type:complete len:176 (+),score=21.84 TRINITY_DN4301_c1_g1_i12:377-904(+)
MEVKVRNQSTQIAVEIDFYVYFFEVFGPPLQVAVQLMIVQDVDSGEINPIVDDTIQALLQMAINAKDCTKTADAIAEERALTYVSSIQDGEETSEEIGRSLLGQLVGSFANMGFEWDGDSFNTLENITNALDSASNKTVYNTQQNLVTTYHATFDALRVALDPIIQRGCTFIFET